MCHLLTLEEVSKIKDKKVVEGYIRTGLSNHNLNIPAEIIHLCFIFYHFINHETFKHYNHYNYRVSNNDLTLTRIAGSGEGICYGSHSISSLDGGKYVWKFKIIKMTYIMAIGIDETKYAKQSVGYPNEKIDETKLYVLWHDGDANTWDNPYGLVKRKADAPRFNQNDKVSMTLDLSSRTLSYQVNDDDKYIAFTNIAVGEDIEYCMCVYIASNSHCAELLSFHLSL